MTNLSRSFLFAALTVLPLFAGAQTVPNTFFGCPGFCDSDNDQSNGGCYSSLNGQPLGMTEVDGGGAQAYGLAFGLSWDDLTPGQCVQLLDPETESDAIN